MNNLLIGALTLLAIFNIAISLAILRSSAYEARQKWLQLLVIWFVPVLGAMFVWSVLRGARGEQIAPEFSERSAYGVNPGEHTNLQSDAADVGGFGTNHDS